ncbi:MAG: hypothetical protein LAT62_00100 [Natronospirillum sp.]|uniref:hypothetical protein n=1 Tax=Natronospirillum sp. TaxID=2812955 RepID=UPI0025EBACF4|nr:hypothetical protein [Natronospirillum sp.]MCH8550301.1 hypothetical protein [Natronospirillum sp.]
MKTLPLMSSPGSAFRPLLIPLAAAGILLITGCESGSSSSSEEVGSGDTNPRLLTSINTSAAVDSQTPNALRSGDPVSGNSLILGRSDGFSPRNFNAFEYCEGEHGAGTAKFNACDMSYQLKETFFTGGGVTEIRQSLQRIDEAIEPYLNPERYYGCADPDSDDFVEATVSPTLEFPNGDDISDVGIPDSIAVNCLLELEGEDGVPTKWVAMGIDDDSTITVVEGNNEGLNTYFLTVTVEGDIDAWFTVGTAPESFNTDGSEKDVELQTDGDGMERPNEVYTGSTGLYRVYSDSSSGLIQLSVVGNGGMGRGGCGMRAITDGQYMYFNGNINGAMGQCFVDDDAYRAEDFEADHVEFEVCMTVSDDQFEFLDNLEDCAARGLAPTNETNGGGDTENVSLDEIFNIDLITREQFKPFNVGLMFTDPPRLNGSDTVMTDTGFADVLPPEPNSATLAGYQRGDLFFRVGEQSDAARGFCDETDEVVVEASMTLTVADFSEEALGNFDGAAVRQVVVNVSSGLRESGSFSYWADYDLEIEVKQGDATITTWSNQTTPSDRGPLRLSADLQPGFSLASDDVLTITMKGTAEYKCSAELANRYAVARPSLGRASLRYYWEAETD